MLGARPPLNASGEMVRGRRICYTIHTDNNQGRASGMPTAQRIRRKYLRLASDGGPPPKEQPVGAWECTLSTQRIAWSAETFEIFGLPTSFPLERQRTVEMYEARSRALMTYHRQQCIDTGAPFQIDVMIEDGLGQARHMRLTGNALRANGVTERLIGTKKDITAEVQALDRLRDSATLDALTGVAGRTVFDQALTALGTEDNTDFHGVFVLDLDSFKQVNDGQGHACGDQYLRMIGQRLSLFCAEWALVTRFGGDEFAGFIFRPMSPAAATRYAVRLARLIRSPFFWEGQIMTPSASIGVALRAECAATAVFSCADRRLYAAKSARLADLTPPACKVQPLF